MEQGIKVEPMFRIEYQSRMQTILRSLPHSLRRFVLLCICSTWHLSAQTNSITFTNRHGEVYQDVRILKIDENGLQYRYNQGIGGGSIKLSELPDNLLVKFGYNPAQAVIHDQGKAAEEASHQLERAIAGGLFREVEGVVYDLRKTQPGWRVFQNVRMIQRLENGDALVDPTPCDPYSEAVLHVIPFLVRSCTI